MSVLKIQYREYTIKVRKWRPTKNWPRDVPARFEYSIYNKDGDFIISRTGYYSAFETRQTAEKHIDWIIGG